MSKLYATLFSVIIVAAILYGTPVTANAAGASSSDFLSEEGTPPPGANDASCRPSDEHPNPVVLVPGTFETMERNFIDLAPVLKQKGYCVYSLNYGYTGSVPASGPIEDSAMELKIFIDHVLQLTGAEKVSIVGHSQGGMMPRYYTKFLGGDQKVDDLIGLVPSNHGTKGVAGLTELTTTGADLASCEACHQQSADSDFIAKLNEGDETPGNISYTNVSTRNDEIVVPYTSAFLSGNPSQTTNVTIQDYYPYDQIEHQNIAQDPLAFKFVFDALDHDGPADAKRASGIFQ
ncbi:esterase/lipase family protein [Fictibacillus barbaricus]|uniref:Triacylglycerol esterase/lipase EstA (Alpha/beta hydrolase family) n=1 Tax=Fictibacillus barbaricus TaxID=182136 RepID=A0ABU1U0L4_9BACL|nr:alpha/beta fold hydrolase [Fictibacillus barbaricus]MDR7073005.1 triacylglycerol esterase/lipase EstA (alpha/beta hydrolase family) [Fictibacillus barbaricus]